MNTPSECIGLKLGLEQLLQTQGEGRMSADEIIGGIACGHMLETNRRCPFKGRILEGRVQILDEHGQPLPQLCPDQAGPYYDAHDLRETIHRLAGTIISEQEQPPHDPAG